MLDRPLTGLQYGSRKLIDDNLSTREFFTCLICTSAFPPPLARARADSVFSLCLDSGWCVLVLTTENKC